MGNETAEPDDTVTKLSPRSVRETTARLREILTVRGLRLFTIIDQRREAHRVGLELRETRLVVFGSPAAGTPVMAASPLSALDLPLKLLIWDDSGQTKVSYTSWQALAARYRLSPQLSGNLAGIDAVCDALVSP